MTDEMISFKVVTKGPAATAGSKDRRRKVMGMRVPKQPAKVMAKVMDKKTISEIVLMGMELSIHEKIRGSPKNVIIAAVIPQQTPMIRPLKHSRIAIEVNWLGRILSRANSRMKTVADCMPVLPPIAAMTVGKAANITTLSRDLRK